VEQGDRSLAVGSHGDAAVDLRHGTPWRRRAGRRDDERAARSAVKLRRAFDPESEVSFGEARESTFDRLKALD